VPGQEPVQGTLRDGVLHLLFTRDSQRTSLHYPTLAGGKTEIGQQRFFFRPGEVGAVSSATSRLFENAYALAQDAGLQIAHRAGMPTEYGGNLRGGEPERGAQPDTQDALMFRVAGGLREQRSELAPCADRKRLGWLPGDCVLLVPP
jgi:hypothetical protein